MLEITCTSIPQYRFFILPKGWTFPNVAAELTSDTSTFSLFLKLYKISLNEKNYIWHDCYIYQLYI